MGRLAEILARQEAIRAQLAELEAMPEPTDEDEAVRAQAIEDRNAVIDELTTEWDQLETEKAPLAARAARLDAVRSASLNGANREGGAGVTPGNAPQIMRQVDPFDGDPVEMISRSVALDRARKAVDMDDLLLTDEQKTHIARSMRVLTGDFNGEYIARRLLLTENEAYRSAFLKQVMFGANAALTPDEATAVARFQQWELQRAMSEGTTTAGGFGVPVFIDPSIILTSGAADAPILRVARIEQITNQVWKGVSSAGVSWSWDAEASAVSDDSPTLAQPAVTSHMARGFIPYSIEVGMDYPGFANGMSMLLNQGYIDLLAVATATGTGSGQPRGIFTALDANTNVEVTPTTDGTFAAVDIFKVWNALPERYRSRATWLMSVSVESTIRQFATNANSSAYFTVDLTAEGVSRINGRPVIVTDYAPGFTGAVPGTTGAANILAVGDFKNYLIAQRAGMSVEQIPMLFDVTNNRPTGQRGWFAWARSGADSINDLGFRLLQNQ